MTKPAAVISTAVFLVNAAGEVLLAQCSMCQASLANSENGAGIIGGFRQGIGFLLGAMILLGIFVWNYARSVCNKFEIRRQQFSNKSSHSAAQDSAAQ